MKTSAYQAYQAYCKFASFWGPDVPPEDVMTDEYKRLRDYRAEKSLRREVYADKVLPYGVMGGVVGGLGGFAATKGHQLGLSGGALSGGLLGILARYMWNKHKYESSQQTDQ